MTRSVRRFRAIFVALAVLAITTTAVLAAHSVPTMPAAAAGGLERAAEAAGKTVPVAGHVEDVDDETGEATDEDAPDADDPADQPADDPADQPADTGAAAPAAHPDNHGKAVSEAAKGPTPAGFDNHGQYVRTIATDNHGHDATADPGSSKKAGTTKPGR